MTKTFVILFIFFGCFQSYAQNYRPISDTEFVWSHVNDCFDSGEALEIFKVVQFPPVLIGVNKKQISNEVDQLIKKYLPKNSEKLIIKIKLFTMLGKEICIGGIGTNREIDTELLNEIRTYISSFKDFEFGTQMGKTKNCHSEIYFITRKNKLHDVHFVNLNLE
jgi:hypothetical protein